jgi:hypothetical protein
MKLVTGVPVNLTTDPESESAVFCHHGMACPLVAERRDDLQIWSKTVKLSL